MKYYETVADKIEETLNAFGEPALVTGYNIGPTVTTYMLDPKQRFVDGSVQLSAQPTKLNKIQALAPDLQLALASKSVRVEPIRGTGLIGIEVANEERTPVLLKDLMKQEKPKDLELLLGMTNTGEVVKLDLKHTAHALIAGATGSGKSVCLNNIISTLVLNNSPEQLRLMLIDPKRVELISYHDLPHLYVPVITDVTKAADALQAVTKEMDRRYKLLAENGCRNIEAYNKKDSMPYLVVVIDELADLMLTSPDEVETSIVRIAQLGRAAGISMIVATQRPVVKVINGIIKSNILYRIAFSVASSIDSRVILDDVGAEQLLGNGDGIVSNESGMTRFQGAFITDDEINAIVEFRKRVDKPKRKV